MQWDELYVYFDDTKLSRLTAEVWLSFFWGHFGPGWHHLGSYHHSESYYLSVTGLENGPTESHDEARKPKLHWVFFNSVTKVFPLDYMFLPLYINYLNFSELNFSETIICYFHHKDFIWNLNCFLLYMYSIIVFPKYKFFFTWNKVF